MTNLKLKKIYNDAQLPEYATAGAAGLDLRAYCPDQPIRLFSNSALLIPTGIALEIPPGFEGQIRSRSGLALKNHITVANSPGTIDEDFRGEVKVLLMNLGGTYEIKHGDRIAQLVIARYEKVNIVVTEELGASNRGEGGFGSTGIK